MAAVALGTRLPENSEGGQRGVDGGRLGLASASAAVSAEVALVALVTFVTFAAFAASVDLALMAAAVAAETAVAATSATGAQLLTKNESGGRGDTIAPPTPKAGLEPLKDLLSPPSLPDVENRADERGDGLANLPEQATAAGWTEYRAESYRRADADRRACAAECAAPGIAAAAAAAARPAAAVLESALADVEPGGKVVFE